MLNVKVLVSIHNFAIVAVVCSDSAAVSSSCLDTSSLIHEHIAKNFSKCLKKQLNFYHQVTTQLTQEITKQKKAGGCCSKQKTNITKRGALDCSSVVVKLW